MKCIINHVNEHIQTAVTFLGLCEAINYTDN